MLTLETVLAAIQAVGTLEPAFVSLINEVKQAFGSDDQATIDAAMKAADASADTQHQQAQSF